VVARQGLRWVTPQRRHCPLSRSRIRPLGLFYLGTQPCIIIPEPPVHVITKAAAARPPKFLIRAPVYIVLQCCRVLRGLECNINPSVELGHGRRLVSLTVKLTSLNCSKSSEPAHRARPVLSLNLQHRAFLEKNSQDCRSSRPAPPAHPSLPRASTKPRRAPRGPASSCCFPPQQVG
jgi:hypothetical protein